MEANEINNATFTVKDLWNKLEFEGKNQYQLNDANELYYTDVHNTQKPILISKLDTVSFDTVTTLLQEKYQEIKKEVENILAQWNASDDKMKFVGKVERTYDYLMNAKVLGNISMLKKDLSVLLEHIQKVYTENYNIRLAIVEKAEALKDSTEFKTTNIAFKDIVEAWKNAPPIERNKLEELWQRIENARQLFFEKKRAHQEEIELQLLQNLDLKLELCEKANALKDSTEWKETTEKFKQLTEEWKKIGRVVSPEKNEELWNRFIGAQNIFFENKRKHFEIIQQEQAINEQEKLSIIEKIESIILEDCNWKETTDLIAELSEKWKNTGRVAKEKSDELWNRFQNAKTRFFDAKRKHNDEVRITLEDNLAKKQALVNRIEKLKNSYQWRETTQEINALMEEWKTIGPVPREHNNSLWEQFINARNHFFERKDADRIARQEQFNSKINSRIEQTLAFLTQLQEELMQDKEKVEEFKVSITELNLENAKDKELHDHLNNLINNITAKIPTREKKIEEVKLQLEELEKKKAELDNKQNNN